MSETKSKAPQSISAEEVGDVSGGGSYLCNANELDTLLRGLTANYETLIDTVSHMIGRVAGK